MPTAAGQPPARRRRLDTRVLLPAAALALMLGVIFLLQPRAMSYNGLRLLLGLGLPLMFAAMAQLCVIAASDIDFLVDQVLTHRVPLNVGEVEASDITLHIGLTSASTGQLGDLT